MSGPYPSNCKGEIDLTMSADVADVKSSGRGLSSDVHEHAALPDPANCSGCMIMMPTRLLSALGARDWTLLEQLR